MVAYDIGRAVNPMLVEGQIAGGVAQGLGGALLEEFVLRRARPAAGGDASPTICCRPSPRCRRSRCCSPRTRRARSTRSASRAPARAASTASGAAIAGAVDDAIGMPGAVTRLPITPCRLHALLAAARS